MTKKDLKILLIEDEQAIAQMYKTKLEEEGFEIITTDKGSEAIDLVKKNKFSVILLDVILPEIDGFSLLKTLKETKGVKNIPILLLTNLGQESDRKKGRDLGADEYFVKSDYTPSQIIEEVKKKLNKK